MLAGDLELPTLVRELAEEPGVLDGQHRLGGKGLQRSDALRRERASLATHDHQSAEQSIFPDQRDRDDGAHALPDQKRPGLGGDELAMFDVGDLDGLPDDCGPADPGCVAWIAALSRDACFTRFRLLRCPKDDWRALAMA